VVFILATKVFYLPAAWSGVAVLLAACPCGVNAYIFAERYGEAVPLASSAVALSTLPALVTLVLWLRNLGVG
jgi:malonate transporter